MVQEEQHEAPARNHIYPEILPCGCESRPWRKAEPPGSRASLGLGAVSSQPPRATVVCPEREYGVKKPNILFANPLCSPPSSGQFWKGIFQDLPKVPEKHRFPFLYSSNEAADKRGVSSGSSALKTSALSSGMGESHCRGPGASVGTQPCAPHPDQELKNSGAIVLSN